MLKLKVYAQGVLIGAAMAAAVSLAGCVSAGGGKAAEAAATEVTAVRKTGAEGAAGPGAEASTEPAPSGRDKEGAEGTDKNPANNEAENHEAQTGGGGEYGTKSPPYTWNRREDTSIELPGAYDYRTAGRAPQIGNQGSLGTCWAFASLKALESSLDPQDEMTFSVDHMSIHNSFLLGQDEGGEYPMSMAYLLSWQGPVLESEDHTGTDIPLRV